MQASVWKCRWNFARAGQNRSDPLGVRIGSPAARKMWSCWRLWMKQKFLLCANQSFNTFVSQFGLPTWLWWDTQAQGLNIHLQENVMPRSAMPRRGLNGSLISKLFHPVTSQNNCDHDKGRNSREAGRNERTQRKKSHPLSSAGCNHRKMDRAPLCSCEPHAQFLRGSKKYSERLRERDGKEFYCFYFTT